MKGSKKVLDQLNELLKGELTAADQYFVHSEMYSDWGLTALYERLHHEFEEELEHAKRLIERILFLEGVPKVGARDKLLIGKDVPSMLRNDLKSELGVVAALKKAIKICEEEQDY
ncbi:MAG: bacterioferritin, partial [Sneathiella sp.]